MSKINQKAWLGLVLLVTIMAILLFGIAGSIHYWQAWFYLVVYFSASTFITLYLMINNPALLKRRLSGGPRAEKEKSQKIIMSFTSLAFISSIVISALDKRFGWSSVPVLVIVLGNVFIIISYIVWFFVFKENPFSSATIEIAEEQKVISTGLYGIVRHPMYTGGLLLFLSIPLALGSYWGLVSFAIALPALIWRLLEEERFLENRLQGYKEYCERVRWRLVPGIF